MANNKPGIDWEVVHLEYRANVLSIRQIADRHGITEGAIRKRAKRDGWVRDLSNEIRDVADDMVRKAEVRPSDPVRTVPRTVPERETILANATAIADQKLRTRKQLGQTHQVFDELIEELATINGNIENVRALAEMLRNPDECGQDKLYEAINKSTSLPIRFGMLKTATDAMKNIQAVSRLEYGMDKTTTADDAPKLSPTQVVSRMSYLLSRAGMKVITKDECD